MRQIPSIQTIRTTLEVPRPQDAALMVKYYSDNQQHLARWEPLWGDDYLTVRYWKVLLNQRRKSFKTGTAFRFAAIHKDRTEVIGVCNFSNVAYGAFMACHLGYSVSAKYQGQGFMYEILEAAIDYVFKTVGLHRIMANYLPDNKRSAALLERLGFEREGYAKSYLKINGEWQDHVLTSKLNPNEVNV